MERIRTEAARGRKAVALAVLACLGIAAPALADRAAGPEVLWRAQSGATTEGNAGAMQMQEQLVDQLRRVGVEYPAGQFMTLDQVNRLNSLFNMKLDEPSTRDEAKVILGL